MLEAKLLRTNFLKLSMDEKSEVKLEKHPLVAELKSKM